MLGEDHWKKRAKDARTVAGWLGDDEAKRLLLIVADRYEKIAKIAASKPLGAAPAEKS